MAWQGLLDSPLTIALAVVAALAILVALVQTFRLFWRARVTRWRLDRQRVRAVAGEARAETLLRAVGCAILGRQVTTAYRIVIDGARVDVSLRADYVVERGDRRFVAEVKTGKLAPRIDTAATRRQLLEYLVAFDVDGVLLVDAESDRIHAVEFPIR